MASEAFQIEEEIREILIQQSFGDRNDPKLRDRLKSANRRLQNLRDRGPKKRSKPKRPKLRMLEDLDG